MIFLHSESFENKRFVLDFSIFQKTCFYGQIKGEFFSHGYKIIFFKILASFHMQKNFWKSNVSQGIKNLKGS